MPKNDKNKWIIIIAALVLAAAIIAVYKFTQKPEPSQPLTEEEIIQKWLNTPLPAPRNVDPRIIQNLTAPKPQ